MDLFVALIIGKNVVPLANGCAATCYVGSSYVPDPVDVAGGPDHISGPSFCYI